MCSVYGTELPVHFLITVNPHIDPLEVTPRKLVFSISPLRIVQNLDD